MGTGEGMTGHAGEQRGGGAENQDVEERHYSVLLLPVVDGDRSQEALVTSAPFDGEDGLGEELNVGFKCETVGHGRGRDGACGRAEGSWR